MKTKFFPLVVCFFYVSSSLAVVGEKCQDVAKKYLIKGNLTSPFGGDRLWALHRLSRDYSDDKTAECVEEVRTTALADAREYWLGYVATKYSCSAEDALALAAEIPEQCPQEKYDLIKKNVDYIENIASGKVVAAGKTARASKKPDCDIKKNPLESLIDVGHVATQTLLTDPCAKYGNPELLKNGEPSEGNLSKLKACLSGGSNGAQSLWAAIKGGYNNMVNLISDKGYRASVWAALSDLATVMATSPKETLKAIYNSLVTSVMEYKSELQCMDDAGITKEICSQLTEKGLPALLGVGAIRGIVMAVKVGKKAATGLVIVRDASRAVEVSQGANTAGTVTGAASNAIAALGNSATTPALGSLANATGSASAKGAAQDSAEKLSKGAKAARDSRARASAKAKEQADAKKKAAAEQKAKEDAEKAEEAAKKAEQEKLRAERAKRNNMDPIRDRSEIDRIDRIDMATINSLDDVKAALNLDSRMSKDEVKKEINKLLNKYHADKNPDYESVSNEVTKKLTVMNKFTRGR